MRVYEAAILAGGKSSRMGKDKALLPFGGYTSLARYQYEKLKRVFPNVYISSKAGKFDFQADIVEDGDSELYSPLIALHTLLAHIEGEALFVIAVDMPFVGSAAIEELRRLFEKREGLEAAMLAGPNGREPLCAIYAKSALSEIRKRISRGNHRLNSLIDALEHEELACNEPETLCNLNHPSDYLEALRKKG